jgi:hypothetical protein
MGSASSSFVEMVDSLILVGFAFIVFVIIIIYVDESYESSWIG